MKERSFSGGKSAMCKSLRVGASEQGASGALAGERVEVSLGGSAGARAARARSLYFSRGQGV